MVACAGRPSVDNALAVSSHRAGFAEPQMSKAPVRRLLSAIADLYRSEVATAGEASFMLTSVLQAIASTPYPRAAMRDAETPTARIDKPVSRFVPSLVLPADGPIGEVGRRFVAAEPHLDWLQNPNYTAGRMGADFVDRYGYVEIVGPQRMFRSPATLVGLLLLGPGVHYPDHSHPAEELYHVVSGTAEWWREGAPWQRVPQGTAIHHPPDVRHAMRTADEPLLALYCWRGAVTVAADLTGAAAPTARTKRKTD